MFDFSGCFSSLFGVVKKYPLPMFLIILVVVVFLAAPFLFVYRKARELVPGGSALPAK